MKSYKLSTLTSAILLSGSALFVSGGIAQAADLEDLDVTVHMVGSDDATEIHNEMSMPSTTDTAQENETEHDKSADAHDNTDGTHQEDNDSATEHHQDSQDEAHDAMQDSHDEANDTHQEHQESMDQETQEAQENQDHQDNMNNPNDQPMNP